MAIAVAVIEGLVVLAAVFLLYLLVVAFVPGLSVAPQPLDPQISPARPTQKPPPFRSDVRFDVRGTPVSAWLYRPEPSAGPTPCVVMGCGAAGTKDMGMEPYALRFRDAGCAVLLFDYRHWGESGGEPRQLMWIPYQLEDYAGAVAFARGLGGIDPARLALWGTSLSGGHVVVAAARDHGVACLLAQCPALDGRAQALAAFKKGGMPFSIIVHAQRDLVRSWFGSSAHTLPIIGKPGSVALLTEPATVEAFARLAPEGFVNETCARIVIRGDKYRPVTRARKVRCPALFQICEHDELTPIDATEKAARIMGGLAEVRRYPIGHFDIYFGEHFERSIRDQLAFLRRHLALPS